MTLISPLRKWLIYNNFFTKEKNNHTNLLLDGGKLNISDDKYLSFLKIYTKDLENNFTNYICETKNDYFKFIIDLDFFETKLLGNELIIFYILKIINILKLFINETNKNIFSCYVCLTQPLEKNINGKKCIKTGIHLIFPKLLVNKELSLQIREILLFAQNPIIQALVKA